jgi:hypothetical protein
MLMPGTTQVAKPRAAALNRNRMTMPQVCMPDFCQQMIDRQMGPW